MDDFWSASLTPSSSPGACAQGLGDVHFKCLGGKYYNTYIYIGLEIEVIVSRQLSRSIFWGGVHMVSLLGFRFYGSALVIV